MGTFLRRVATVCGVLFFSLIGTGVAHAATWELTSVGLPAGGTEGELEGVSCFSVNVCTAGGHYSNSSTKGAMGSEWNGTEWKMPPS